MMTDHVRAMGPVLRAAGLALLLSSAAQAAPVMGSLAGQPAVGGTLYLNAGANLALQGTNSDDGDTLTVWVDGVQVATVPAQVYSAGTSFACVFNSPASGVVQALQVQGDHLGTITNSAVQNFLVDTTAPAVPAIHWSSPVDSAFMSTGLGNISATATDTGGAGVDFSSCTITVSGLTGTLGNTVNQIYFTPDGGWTAFQSGTYYTVSVTVRDLAGNFSTACKSFQYDSTAPAVPAIHWSSPVDSAFMSTGLGNISATATDTGGTGVDFSGSTITVSGLTGTLGNAGNQIYFTPNGGWTAFQSGTYYTVSVTVRDLAGNFSTACKSFQYDSTAPAVPAIHWSSPVDSAFMSTGLGNISATATDTGGTGVDFSGSTITVSGLTGTLGSTGNQIYFTPNGGWTAFQSGTYYTVSVTVRDLAGNFSKACKSFQYDSTAPAAPVIHWSSPADYAFMGTGLGNISATATDTGGAGVDFTACTVTVTGISGTRGNTANQIFFTPTAGWNAFQTGTYYTVTVTVKDRAGNLATSCSSFQYDRTSPDFPAIHWSSPVDSAFMSTGLGNISATATDSGGSGVNFSACTITVSGLTGTLNNTANQIYFTPTAGWGAFQTGTYYTVSVSVQDMAGNVTRTCKSFQYDSTPPSVPVIHWTNPLDNPSGWMGVALNAIYANYTDTGGSGVNPAATTITVSAIPSAAATITQTQTNFNPLGPGAFNSRFVTGQAYTVIITVFDRAGNSSTNSKSFSFDGNSPDATAIHWTDPADLIYAGPKLSRIWAANVNDTGGSGLDWNTANTTITVGGIARTTSHTGTTIDFLPTNGFPTTFAPKDFVHDTYYTVSATIYDLAGNHRTDTRQFRCDLQAPTATLYWNNPDRGNPPSYFMGQGLGRIWAVLDGTVTQTNGFNTVDFSNTSTAMAIVPGPSAGSQLNTPAANNGTVDWFIAANYDTRFTNGTLYTVTVNLADMAGNTGSASASFRKDEDKPIVNDIRISNPNTNLFNDDVILRGSAFPLNTNSFTSSITDSPAAWSGHTSLNGWLISYNNLASAPPSDMRIFHEVAGLVNTSTGFAGASFNYAGALTLPGSYTPLEGVYSVSISARDWAHTTLSAVPGSNHETDATSHILVDNTAPTETAVGPPLGPYYVNANRTYLRTLDLNIYPGNVTVTASDTPADRGWKFGHRLNFPASTITLLNPDGVVRPLTFVPATGGWTQPLPVTDLNNLFTSTINTYHNDPFGNDLPIYPRPEYIGNTVEGRYTVAIHLEDRITASLGAPNVRNINYYFFNDVTPPRLLSWSPFSTNPVPDSYTSSFSDVQATIYDPNLRDGFPGSGLNLPACNALLYMALTDSAHPTGLWSTPAGAPGSGTIISSGPFVGPQGQSLNNQTVYAMKVGFVINPGRKIYQEGGKHAATIDNSGSIAFTGLDPSSEYVVGWQIPSAFAQDGVSVIGAVPNTAILKNGIYFTNFSVADMVGNTAQVESVNFNYLSAGGAIYLSVSPTAILADGISTAAVVSTPVHLSDNPSAVVQDGTEVTVSSTLGDIITPDIDPLLPGVQLGTVGGVVSFTIRSRASQAGQAVLRAKSVSGFADSGDVSGKLQMVLSSMTNGAVAVNPATENMAARYTLTGNVNHILPLTAGLDKFLVDFPAGTLLPASLAAGSVLLNQTPATAASISGQRLSVTTPVTLAPGSFFTLTLPPAAGIVNPKAGHYTINLQTTQDVSGITLPYNIMIRIDDQDVVPAPNPCKTGKMRFFFNLSGPARVELLILNLLGDKVSRVEQEFPAAGQGEVLDWDCQHVGPGVYWARMKLDYANGTSVKLKKKKIVIIH